MVEARPSVPASDWRLSAEGRARAAQLAAHLMPYAPSRLVSSLEPKAVEAAAILGKRLGLGVEIVPGLHEHERRSVPYLGAEAFAAAITRFFATPQERVFGQNPPLRRWDDSPARSTISRRPTRLVAHRLY